MAPRAHILFWCCLAALVFFRGIKCETKQQSFKIKKILGSK